MLLHPFIVTVGLLGDVVVYLADLLTEGVTGVGHSVRGGGVDDDTQRLGVKLVGHGRILAAEETHVIGIVAVVDDDLLLGEAQLQNAAKTQGGAYRVAVGTLVTKNDDAVIFFDLLKNDLHLLMHGLLPPKVKVR